MSPHPRPALTLALATALVGVAPLPLAADEPEEPILRCFTEALTVEEVEAGVFSEIECFPADEAPAFRGISAATIYDGTNGSGSSLTVGPAGSSCTGFGINIPPGDFWDNRISSTELLVCGNAKHWTDNGYSGSNQLISGGGIQNLNGTLNNQTSSIQYAP